MNAFPTPKIQDKGNFFDFFGLYGVGQHTDNFQTLSFDVCYWYFEIKEQNTGIFVDIKDSYTCL